MTEKTGEQKSFDLTLSQLKKGVRDIYDDLLLKEQVGRTREAGHIVTITLEDREAILSRARQIAQYGTADPEKMARDWNSYDRRPPIGGAQDD